MILLLILGTSLNPLGPHDALQHHFTSMKTDLIFLQSRVLEQIFRWNWFTNTWQFSLIFQSHQIIFIHHKSRIATAIRGLWWMKMTMVNSDLKGLLKKVLLKADTSCCSKQVLVTIPLRIYGSISTSVVGSAVEVFFCFYPGYHILTGYTHGTWSGYHIYCHSSHGMVWYTCIQFANSLFLRFWRLKNG